MRTTEHGPVPDMSGRAMTVTGPVDPEELGFTLSHEHIFIDLRKTHLPHRKFIVIDDRLVPDPPDEDFPATELSLWEAKVDLGNLHLARSVAPIADNYVLSDEDTAIEEVREYKRHGGNTIVELTSIGLKRDPMALRRVSERTGVHIIMGTAYYQRVYHPDNMDQRSVEDLTATIVKDVVEGVYDSGIRSGIIGEVGINGDPLITNELKSMRAAARASRLTGAPICIHLGGKGVEKHTVLDIVADEGVDLSRVILGHCDGIATDLQFMLELLARGVYAAFDNLGREPEIVVPSRTARVAEAIPPLLDSGYEDRVLLSQDICHKISLKAYGGLGYSFLQEEFLPRLKELGVTQAQIDKFMVENPKRILTFVAPES